MKQIETITKAVLEMEQEKMTLAQFKLTQKLRYYINKYKAEESQTKTQ